MTGFDYFLLAWWVLSALVTIGQIGKRREPITPGLAVFVTVANAGFAFGLLATRGVI